MQVEPQVLEKIAGKQFLLTKGIKTIFVEYYFLKMIFGCFVGFHLSVLVLMGHLKNYFSAEIRLYV